VFTSKLTPRRPAGERRERIQEAYRSGSSSPTKSKSSAAATGTPIDYDAIQQQSVEAAIQGGKATAEFAQGIAGSFWRSTRWFLVAMQKPIGILLFLYALAFAGSMLAGHLRNTILGPFCNIPGASSVLPFCDYSIPNATKGSKTKPHKPAAQRPDFPGLAHVQDTSLGTLLTSSASGSRLALDLKAAQLATADLATLVLVSPLTSRDLIAQTLLEFTDDAKYASRGLTTFDAKLGGAVDSILAINDFALRQIEGAAANAGTLQGRVASALVPWRKSEQERAAIKNFEIAMDTVSTNMARLILEAEVSLGRLEKLQETLATLQEILAREDGVFSEAQDELLGNLWSQLGGNRKLKRDAVATGKLLSHLGGYRKAARAKVVEALQTLQGMEAEMTDLRARVAAPALVGESVPVEVHLQAIRTGVKRLGEGRRRAKEVQESETRKRLEEVQEATWA
jgi:hypothetical protein